MGRVLKSTVIAVGLLFALLSPISVFAAEPVIESIQIGYSGLYKVGHWVPVRVNITSSQALTGRVELTVPDGEGSPCATVYSDQQLSAGKTSLNLLVKFGRVDSYISVRFSPDEKGQDSIERFFSSEKINDAIPTREQLIVSIGSDVGIEQALTQRRRTSNDQYHVALVDSAAALPDEWIGYTGVDMLVLTTLKSDALHELTKLQSNAIVEYVRRGGRVILSAAERAESIFFNSNPLAELLAGRFVETIQETRTGGIEEYVGGANQRLDRSESPDTEFQYPLARVSNVSGQVLASEGVRENRTPLIIVGYSGIGQTIYTAFDLDAPMIATWQDRTELLIRIVEIAFPRTIESEDERSSVSMTRSGFDDLTGQLRVSLESFPGVQLTYFSIVAGFCLLYLVVIGPVDYFFLRKLAKSFSWTWLTFPLAVIGFCAAAFLFFGVVEIS